MLTSHPHPTTTLWIHSEFIKNIKHYSNIIHSEWGCYWIAGWVTWRLWRLWSSAVAWPEDYSHFLTTFPCRTLMQNIYMYFFSIHMRSFHVCCFILSLKDNQRIFNEVLCVAIWGFASCTQSKQIPGQMIKIFNSWRLIYHYSVCVRCSVICCLV